MGKIAFYDPYRDGVTNSMLAKWMECREKARLSLQGWTPKQRSFALTFGTVVHEILQKAYEDLQKGKEIRLKKYLKKIETLWEEENPTVDERTSADFEMSLLFAESVLPVYFDYWEKDSRLDWLAVEKEFEVPWKLPNGKTVSLRGKRDGLFRRGKETWLMEHKTKGRIDEWGLVERISFEQQVMLYLTALLEEDSSKKVNGVLYNILRRPGLKQKVSEPIATFAKRCAEDVEARRDFYFLRLEVSISKQEVSEFKGQLGAAIWDFVQWTEGKVGHYRNTGACEGKYGTCEMIGVCGSGNYSRLFKRDKVSPELG